MSNQLPAPPTLDPLTGLPVIRVVHAVNRVLGTTGRNEFAPAMEETLRAELRVVEIADLEFFRWSDFVYFLETVQPDVGDAP
jgi:hypothetical protein